eukprot:TRINITY_DN8614_c0_g3_i1.p1 TRINITY_DN8614_c0_g3~~TRINITY_DN8614_c0_g3_i1.p1  ORF type:complete len:238 (-),score=45.90 TRINITY_DN8614_c0_g3_i1:75-710(-)
MTFAWCTFYGLVWLVAQWITEGMIGIYTLAVSLSLISFLVIWLLDKIADADMSPPIVDKVIRKVIGAVGILIGFSWEQCFDEALESIAEVCGGYEHVIKFGLSVLCVAILIPAWKWYILPMEILDGWKHGFIVRKGAADTLIAHIAHQEHKLTTKDAGSLDLPDVKHSRQRVRLTQWVSALRRHRSHHWTDRETSASPIIGKLESLFAWST